jgi:hypothetical protein
VRRKGKCWCQNLEGFIIMPSRNLNYIPNHMNFWWLRREREHEEEEGITYREGGI